MDRDGNRNGETPSESIVAFGVNAGIVDDIQRRYEVDPTSVDESWAEWFDEDRPSARERGIERFLQSCADDALQIVNCTTAAQYFHVLRRQMRRPYRAPLVIFTPKSLLRSRLASATSEELANGRFSTVLDDPHESIRPEAVEQIVFCSGKLYYDLAEQRERSRVDPGRGAIVRLEQLYPWPEEEIARSISRYPAARSVVWAQEEPANMGAWTFVRERIQSAMQPEQRLTYAGRRESASPATGSMRIHRAEQQAILDAVFAGHPTRRV